MYGVVELVRVDAVDFRDVVVAVGGEVVEQAVEEFKGSETEFRWENCVEQALTESPDSHHRRHGCPNLLHPRRFKGVRGVRKNGQKEAAVVGRRMGAGFWEEKAWSDDETCGIYRGKLMDYEDPVGTMEKCNMVIGNIGRRMEK